MLDRCCDLHAEFEKERAAGTFTFAELGENEEDLDELEACCAKVSSWVRSSADETG